MHSLAEAQDEVKKKVMFAMFREVQKDQLGLRVSWPQLALGKNKKAQIDYKAKLLLTCKLKINENYIL